LGKCQAVKRNIGQKRAVHRYFLNRGFVFVLFLLCLSACFSQSELTVQIAVTQIGFSAVFHTNSVVVFAAGFTAIGLLRSRVTANPSNG